MTPASMASAREPESITVHRAADLNRPAPGRPPGRRLSWARTLYPLAVAVASCLMLTDRIPVIVRTMATSASYDLIVDYQPARAVWEGYNPYTPEGLVRSGAGRMGAAAFGHPPSTAFWLLPLARFDLHTANTTWCWITLLLLLFEIGMLMNALRCPAPNATAWLVFSYFLSSPAALYHVSVGQFSQVIGFLFLLTWMELRAGRELTAGLSLGAACSMKFFPAVMLLYLLICRRYRALVTAIVTAVAVAVGMTAALGFQSWGEFLKRQPIVADRWMNSIQNMSLHGIVSRFFFPTCAGGGHVLRSATLISSGLALLIIGAASWWTRRLSRDSSSSDLTFGAFVMVSVFTSQWVWEHYKVIYVLPLALLASQLIGLMKRRRPWWLAVLAAVTIVAALVEMQTPLIIKASLQTAVHQGAMDSHFKLHLFEVFNWAPTALLVITFGVLLLDRVREQNQHQAA